MLVYGFFISLPFSRCSRFFKWQLNQLTVFNCTSRTGGLINVPPLQEKEYQSPFICEITFAASAKVNLENGQQEGSGPRKFRQYIILLLLKELLATLVYDNLVFHALA